MNQLSYFSHHTGYYTSRAGRPAQLDDLGGIPFALGVPSNLGEERDEVEPCQLVSRLLTNEVTRGAGAPSGASVQGVLIGNRIDKRHHALMRPIRRSSASSRPSLAAALARPSQVLGDNRFA